MIHFIASFCVLIVSRYKPLLLDHFIASLCVSFQGISHSSDESLERRSSLPRMKSYDAVVFEILRVSPDDFAVRINF